MSWKRPYVPERGDVVSVDFTPQSGHEQAGRRPALVISPSSYNRLFGLAMVAPITNQRKGLPFEVPLPGHLSTTGVVLADQFKSLDLRSRKAAFIEKADADTVNEVVGRHLPLIDPDHEFTDGPDEG